MAMGIKKLFATAESRSSIMLISGIVSLLAALAVAVAVWQRWDDTGVVLGTRRIVGIVICSVVGLLLAGSTGIWALLTVNKLEGRNATKCTAGYLLDALALAIIIAFVIIAYYLRAVIVY